MKPLLLSLASFLALLVATPSSGPPELERVDTNHSTCGFSVPILGGLSRVTGKFSSFRVELDFDPADPEAATVLVDIDAASADTGIDARDAHLRRDDFFDVENHPRILFESREVTVLEGDRLEVEGILTLRGTTREVTLRVELLRPEDPSSDVVGFTAQTTLDRREFGVSYQHRAFTFRRLPPA